MKINRQKLQRIVVSELAEHIKNLLEAPEKKDSDKEDQKNNSPIKNVDVKKQEYQPKKLPVENEPADDITNKEGKNDISDNVVGKTIQSITMEPTSKLLPGSKELTITFNEITDQFKILITKTGNIKFYFRGLHNIL